MWRRVLLMLIGGALVAGGVVAPAAAEPAGPMQSAGPGSYRLDALHPAQANGTAIASISIPSIGVEEPIRAGVAPKVIDLGVAHWAGTSMPGGPGNVVLAGHRTSHTRPFHDLDRLKPGQLIFLTDPSGFDVMYRVTDIFVVTPKDIWITFDQGRPMLTLFACHPKGSQSRRIVVQADLIGGGRIA